MVISIEEISISVSIPSLIKDSFIRSGKFSVLDNGDYEMSTGGFSVVFPVIVGDEKWAFRCWHVTIDKAMERYKLLSQALPSYKLPYFIDFNYEEKGIVVSGITYPTIRMRWVNGKNIKDYIGRNLNDSEKIFRLADRFLKMVRVLHKSSIAHGDLQHENIMVNTRGNLVLIDYDSLFLPELRGIADEDIIAGKPDYQHPCRKKNKIASQKIDYFSEVVILLGILGIARDKTLWEKYHVAGSDGLLFSKDDYYNLKESRIYSDLYRFGHPFSDLLDILCTYLQSADINQLEPLESFGIFADESLDLVQYFEEQRAQEKETVLWTEVSRIDTKQSYIKYLSVFPNGKYSDIAERKIYEIEEKEKNAAEITKRDNEAWHNAYTVGTVESYTKYLQDFPSGVNAKDAKARIETIYWKNAQEADTAESYQSYLTHFSYGAYTTRAKNRIKQIEEELKLWNYAEKENTISSYNLYLKKYPDGKHRDEANRRIKSLVERLKRRKRIRKAVVSILCCALLILSVFVGPSIVTYINQNSSGGAVKNSQVVRPIDVSALERDAEKVIAAMEVTKSNGGTVNDTIRKKAEELLSELKSTNSTRYDKLNRRYNNL